MTDLRTVLDTPTWFTKLPPVSAQEYLYSIVRPVVRAELEASTHELLPAHRVKPTEASQVTHYTTITAVYHMLRALRTPGAPPPTLRLYDSIHSNDPDEGNFLLRKLSHRYSWLTSPTRSYAYILSFVLPHRSPTHTDSADDLPFWRAYGDDGAGCSLTVTVPHERLRAVLYDPTDIVRVEHGVQSTFAPLTEFYNRLSAAPPNFLAAVSSTLTDLVAHGLEPLRYLYKDPAYEDERECRVILPHSHAPSAEIEYDLRDTGRGPRLRHYVEEPALQLTNIFTSGSGIHIGPATPHKDDVKSALTQLIRQTPLYDPPNRHVPVTVSDIPYRHP